MTNALLKPGGLARTLLASVCLFGLGAARPAWALENGLARTPPMGWNSWNLKLGPISAAEVRRITDAIVSTGMRDLGYQYVVIDDCWSDRARDAAGNLVPTKALFPDGIKALADYVHDSGLKFGMYATPTTVTCCRHPGSYTHERQDARNFAAWGVDFLKYDWCGVQSGEQGKVNQADLVGRYTTMRDELAATQRPFLLSLCEKGQETGLLPADTATWSVSVGNMWRNTGDIGANWRSVLSNFDKQLGALERQGPGGWNDPDMLQVGNTGLSDSENRAHFSLWAIIAAPLMAGNDPSNMSAATRATMTNAEVIAVDQDPLGKAGQRVAQAGMTEVWAKPMQDGSKAVLMLNRGTTPAQVTATWADVKITGPAGVRDLWAHADQGSFAAEYSATVGGHDVVVLRVYPPGVAWAGRRRAVSRRCVDARRRCRRWPGRRRRGTRPRPRRRGGRAVHGVLARQRPRQRPRHRHDGGDGHGRRGPSDRSGGCSAGERGRAGSERRPRPRDGDRAHGGQRVFDRGCDSRHLERAVGGGDRAGAGPEAPKRYPLSRMNSLPADLGFCYCGCTLEAVTLFTDWLSRRSWARRSSTVKGMS